VVAGYPHVASSSYQVSFKIVHPFQKFKRGLHTNTHKCHRGPHACYFFNFYAGKWAQKVSYVSLRRSKQMVGIFKTELDIPQFEQHMKNGTLNHSVSFIQMSFGLNIPNSGRTGHEAGVCECRTPPRSGVFIFTVTPNILGPSLWNSLHVNPQTSETSEG